MAEVDDVPASLSILPADLHERAINNHGLPDPLVNLPPTAAGPLSPGVPSPPPPPPPVPAQPPAAAVPAQPPAPRVPGIESDAVPTDWLGGKPPTDHVLRLSGQVRALNYALDYVRQQLVQALAACSRESDSRVTTEAQLESARAHLERLIAETTKLRQSLEGAHRAAEQWSEQARRAETRLKSGLPAHEAAINQLRKTAAEQHAELEMIRAERDAAHLRIAELEAELTQHRTRHPRGGIAHSTPPAAVTVPTPASPATPPVPVPAPAPTSNEMPDVRPASLAAIFDLDPWQRDALASWTTAGNRGVVEAVTSEGNARLACWAIGRALEADMKVLVIAATTDRMDEWYDGLCRAFPDNVIGKHYGRGHGRLAAHDVVIATVQSTTKEHVFEPGLGVLVVVDEVNDLATPASLRALDDTYPWRLGLTSSYDIDDDGVAAYLDWYFGGVCFRLDFDRAVAEHAIASFDIALVSVALSSAEQGEYDACAAATLTGGGSGVAAAKTAVRAYLKAIARRDEILMNTAARDSVLRVLATAVHESGRAQVVAPSAHVAHRVARLFEEKGCAATPIHTSSEGESRIRRGGKDDEHDVWQLITPAVGPQPGAPTEADLGIVLSPARNRRQLVERMQRNLGGRRDRHVRLVVLYIEGSVEDDAVGEETALGGVMTHARRLQRFTSRDTDALLDFLSSGRRVVTLPADTEVSQQIPTNR